MLRLRGWEVTTVLLPAAGLGVVATAFLWHTVRLWREAKAERQRARRLMSEASSMYDRAESLVAQAEKTRADYSAALVQPPRRARS